MQFTNTKKRDTRTLQAVRAERDAWYDTKNGKPGLVSMHKRRATELMVPEESPIVCNGEVVPMTQEGNWIRDTLASPDTPAIDASIARTDMLENNHSLDIGLDAANSIEARNSLEKMLAHQMATCHIKAMSLLAESNNHTRTEGEQHLQLKRISVAAKLIETYQKGMETLSRTRNAGKQTITVKQVHVTGGQNIVADNVSTRGFTGLEG